MPLPKGSPKRSGARKDAPKGSWYMPWGKTVEPDEGPVIRRSLSKTLLKIGFALLAALGGVGITGVSIGGAMQAWTQKPDHLVLILLALTVFAAVGLGLLILGAALVVVFLLALYRKERFIIGTTCLQCIFGAAKANLQLPFDNIRKLALATKANPGGAEFTFIGIDLFDAHRDDTIVDLSGLAANRQNYGFDQVIFDDYEMPLEKLFDQLKKRWMKAKRSASEEKNDDDDDTPPRKRLKTR